MMIKKELKLLPKAKAIECLLARLPEQHPQREYLEKQLHRTSAGVRGENKLQKKFQEFYTEEAYVALWDINMRVGEWKVQMDGLLLTDKCAIILESKNISDQLHYEEHTEEFYKTTPGGERMTLEDPAVQLNKHIRFLERWFKKHKITLPVTGLIVFTANNCMFHDKPPGAFVCKTYQMNEYLYRILQKYPQDASSHKISRIKKMIAANQVPFERYPLCEVYQIDSLELKTGVQCGSCSAYTMQRHKKTWLCSDCGSREHGAHQLALQEYFSLISTQATNKDLRSFFGVSSQPSVWRILTQYDLDMSGERKSRVYKMKKYE